MFVYELHDVVLQLTGDLCADHVGDFRDSAVAAIGERPRRLIVELSAVERCDDDGLQALGSARDRSSAAGVDFVLDSPPPVVRARLDALGVGAHFFVR